MTMEFIGGPFDGQTRDDPETATVQVPQLRSGRITIHVYQRSETTGTARYEYRGEQEAR